MYTDYITSLEQFIFPHDKLNSWKPVLWSWGLNRIEHHLEAMYLHIPIPKIAPLPSIILDKYISTLPSCAIREGAGGPTRKKSIPAYEFPKFTLTFFTFFIVKRNYFHISLNLISCPNRNLESFELALWTSIASFWYADLHILCFIGHPVHCHFSKFFYFFRLMC
jgi:hypothetical protein